MITAKQVITKASDKKRKITLVILDITILLFLGIGTAIELGYADATTTATNSYKQQLCTGKVLEFAQTGIIRDAGGFNGAIYECINMKYTNSIYGNVV